MTHADVFNKRELLTAEEVAAYLRVAPNTVYRWCRDGKLTAIKLGKEWRVSPGDLQAFVNARRMGEKVAPLADIMAGNLAPPEHVLVMMTDPDAVYEMEADFFQIGRRQSRPMLKGCWWQNPDEVRARYSAAGLPVARWEREGRLELHDFWTLYRQRGPTAVYECWARFAGRHKGEVFWGAGSHLVNDWDGNFAGLHAFEEGLHGLLGQLPVVALCCCVVAPAETGATAALINLAAHHTGSLFVAQGDAVLMRPVSVT